MSIHLRVEDIPGNGQERKESNGNIYRSKRFLSIEGFYDIDDGHEMESGFDLTQNLFNTDDKYEYLCAYYELVKGSTQEHDRDGDGMIDERITYYHTEISKIACESEGGKILWQIDAIDSYAYIYKWHGKYYLYTESALYLIDKESTGLKTVQNTGSMKVFPTLAGPSDAITIELNAAGGNTFASSVHIRCSRTDRRQPYRRSREEQRIGRRRPFPFRHVQFHARRERTNSGQWKNHCPVIAVDQFQEIAPASKMKPGFYFFPFSEYLRTFPLLSFRPEAVGRV